MLRRKRETWRKGGKVLQFPGFSYALTLSLMKCVHKCCIFRYTTNVHLMNFSLHFTVLRLSYRVPHKKESRPYICVCHLLNIIPHLFFGRLWRLMDAIDFLFVVVTFFHINLCIVKNWFFSLLLHNFIPIHEHNFFFLATVQMIFSPFCIRNCIKASPTIKVAFHDLLQELFFSKLKIFQLISLAVGKIYCHVNNDARLNSAHLLIYSSDESVLSRESKPYSKEVIVCSILIYTCMIF